jgi:hypothetical protein
MIRLWRDESGLVSALEMVLSVMLSFFLTVFAVLMILYALFGIMVDNAALVSARSATQFLFPAQDTKAALYAQKVWAGEMPQSSTTQCARLNVVDPTRPGQDFKVSSICTVNMGSFMGVPIKTTWTATASVPIQQVATS